MQMHTMAAPSIRNPEGAFNSGPLHASVEIVAARRAAGRPIPQFDPQIATMARRHSPGHLHVDDFQGCDLELVNRCRTARCGKRRPGPQVEKLTFATC